MMLGGDHWDAAGLNVKTGNGAISIPVPQGYSAHFDATTTVGVISTNYPVQVSKGKWGILNLGGLLSFEAGSGGAPIQVSTTVGSIRIEAEPWGGRRRLFRPTDHVISPSTPGYPWIRWTVPAAPAASRSFP